MRTLKFCLMAALTVSLVGVTGAEEKKEEKKDGPAAIKAVMKKFHSAPKGEDPICKQFLMGKASETDIKALLAGYEDLGKNKPPKGDEEAWKKRTTALLSAAKDLAAKKDGAMDAYKAAVNCMTCHETFRPAKDK
jgi:hypothetical protein